MFPLLILALAYTTLWYFLSLFVRRADIMDIAWGIGFVVLVWIWHSFFTPQIFLFLVLLTVHQLRLSLYILWRMQGKPEDKRYAAWRNEWGKTFWWRSYLQIFILQGIIMAIVLGSLITNVPSTISPFLQVFGGGLWLYGAIYEVLGDWQLLRFKTNAQNKGKVLKTGVWGRTRHPNYWGECCLWWSYWLLLGAPLIGIVAPVLMTFLLLKVSGVAMTERTMKQAPKYIEYQKNVPPFAPTKHFF